MTRLFVKHYNPKWSTHIPLLIKVIKMSTGPVLELGMGPASTPILHQLCGDMGRKLVSYESDPYYFERHCEFRTDMHEINKVENWDDLKVDDIDWGVIFVDHSPDSRRKTEIERLANKTQYMVVHDTEPGARKHYHFETVFPSFKYKFDYTRVEPNTSVLSNFIDVTKLVI